MYDKPVASPLLDERHAAEFLSVSSRTLQSWRARKEGPVFIKLGRTVRYRLSDLIQWINDCAKGKSSANAVR